MRTSPPLWRLLLAGGCALALASAACKPGNADGEGIQAAATGARQRETPKVRVETVERREMRRVLETTAKVESEREIEVYPRMGGRVIELLAEEGDRVGADQVLARLDSREQDNAVLDAEIALVVARENRQQLLVTQNETKARVASLVLASLQAERDHQRNLSLAADTSVASPISAKDVETSKLAYDNALAAQEQAELALERTELEVESTDSSIRRAELALEQAQLTQSYAEIMAPFAGVVARRSCRVGQELMAGAGAFTLTDPDNLRAVFQRPQAELPIFSRSAEPLEVSATAEAAPGVIFRGQVLRTSPTIDPDSGNFRVTARLQASADPEQPGAARLLPGMLVRLVIVTDRHPEALVVPKRALRREGEDVFLLRVVDAAVQRVLVSELGDYADDDFTEIEVLEGELGPRDAVVVVGTRDLEEGSLVEIEAEEVAEPEPEEAPESASPEEPAGPAPAPDASQPDPAGAEPESTPGR